MKDAYGTAVSADPAAGAEHAVTLSATDGDKILKSFSFVLVTDANAANRYVGISIEDVNGRVFFRTGASAVQVASKTYNYGAWGTGFTSPALYGIDYVIIALPPGGVYCPAGSVLRTDTEAIQATDNFGVLAYQFERAQ